MTSYAVGIKLFYHHRSLDLYLRVHEWLTWRDKKIKKIVAWLVRRLQFIYKYVLVHIKEHRTYITYIAVSTEATPKAVKDTMEVEGIALHHVKSHLQVILSYLLHMNHFCNLFNTRIFVSFQKFRLGRCNIRDETDQYHKRMFSAIALSFRFYVFFFGTILVENSF